MSFPSPATTPLATPTMDNMMEKLGSPGKYQVRAVILVILYYKAYITGCCVAAVSHQLHPRSDQPLVGHVGGGHGPPLQGNHPDLGSI